MAALRVLHVVPYYENAWAYGGIPRVAAAMAQGLARRGHQVTVCTTDACDASARLPARVEPSSRADVTIEVFPNLSNRLAYHLQFFTPVGLGAYLRRHRSAFDIAHLHACRNLPAEFAARILRRANVPYVLSPNGTAPIIERRFAAKRLFDLAFGRGTLRYAARVLAVTEAERRQLVALGVERGRIAIVPNPVEEAHTDGAPAADFRSRYTTGNGAVVLFLGKLTPRKGVDVLVRALARLPHRDATLIVAGNDMGAGAHADALIASLGLGHRVRRLGLLTGRDRLDALAAADVVVYPSRDEIFGLVAMEALLCGTPVVVCDDSGCGEIVRDAGGGLIVPYGNPQALAAAMDDMLASPALWRARAIAAAPRIRARFGANVVCERVEAVYVEVLGARRAARACGPSEPRSRRARASGGGAPRALRS
jgi:glycosyltransferase involved in cell wall biosynthesis